VDNRKTTIVFLFLIVFSSLNVFAYEAEPYLDTFSTDGCSNYPDGKLHTLKKEWLHCCVVHDRAYWLGGMKSERKKADKALKQCIFNINKSPLNKLRAKAMYTAVRLFGGPKFNMSYSWGYGWSQNLDYMDFPEQVRDAAESHWMQFVLDHMEDSDLKQLDLPFIFQPLQNVVFSFDQLEADDDL
jgi:hypothetical protein